MRHLGERLPERVEVVFESVGQATWAHSVRSLRPGGRIVVCGATSGPAPSAELTHVFFRQLSVVGSTMGTRAQLEKLAEFLVRTGVRPEIDRVLPESPAQKAGFKEHDVLVTVDGKPSAHFEHTIAITEHGPDILTKVA